MTNLLSKITARYEVRSAQPLTVYRATNDVYPSAVNHLYKGSGVFGNGTYFGLDYETAQHYCASLEEFSIVCRYRLAPNESARITSDDFEGLREASKNKLKVKSAEAEDLATEDIGTIVPAKSLSKKAIEAGVDALIIDGDTPDEVDGGPQVLVPEGQKPKIDLEHFHLYIHEDSEWTLNKFRKAFKVQEMAWGYGNAIRFGPFPTSDWDRVDAMLQDSFKSLRDDA